MASIGERFNGDGTVTYRVQFRLDGQNKQVSFTHAEGAREFKRLTETVGGHAALQVLKARQHKAPDMPTLREWVQKYLDPASGLLTGIEPGTRAGYRQAAERSFLKVLGDYPVDAIQKADVGRWVAWQEQQPSQRRDGPVSAKTVRNYHAVLSAALQAAVEERLREGNPAYRTRMTRGLRREGVFLTPDEFATLLHFIPDRYQTFVLFLAGTGCRWGEATAIQWGDLRLNANPPTVRIERAWKAGVGGVPVLKQPKSSKGKRTVSIFPDLVHALGKPGPATALVFPGRNGGHMWNSSFRENVWAPSVKRAQDPELCEAEGLEPLRKSPNIHDLRHSHASWLIADGAPLPYIQQRLGHESINTTVNIYGHAVPEAHTQMAGMIARTLTGVRPMRAVEA